MARIPMSGEVDALLAQADWLRGLAVCLVHNGPDADDLVQETWVAAMRSPPEPGRPPRPWLAQVVRNLVRMNARGAARRRAREDEAARVAGEAPGTEGVLERLELQRMLATMVKELEEPFRTTLLLRFFESRAPADIAAAQGIPAGTVRWRVNEGLRRLRQRLDEAHGGQRDAWRSVLVLAGAPGAGRATAPAVRAPMATRALIGLGALATGAIGLVLWTQTASAPSPPPATVSAPTAAAVNPKPTTAEERQMQMKKSRPGTATFFGILLPALVASAEDSKRLTPDETIDFCVEMREKQFTCKEVIADVRVSRVPADKREGSRRMVLKEITEDGTGPLEPRKAKCATDLKLPKAAWIGFLTKADVAAIRSCNVEKDCKNGVACWMNAVEPVVARSRKP
jgi:RNA polymerase sigma-70 factor (ECF subfamily)